MFKIIEKAEDGKITIVQAGKVLINSTALWIIGIIFWVTSLGSVFVDWLGSCYLGLAVIIATLTLNAIIIIPTVYFGIPSRFKERIKNKDGKAIILEEGINFRVPLIDDLLFDNTKSKKLTTQNVTTTALSKDKLEITLVGSVQYRPADLNTYIEMTEKTIREGMIEAVESELGKICGIKESDVFVDERTQLEFLIRCVLQLERRPHYYIDEASRFDRIKYKAKKIKKLAGLEERELEKVEDLNLVGEAVMGIILKDSFIEAINDNFGPEKTKELVDKLSPEKWKMPLENEDKIDIIRFYRDNVSRINLLFEFGQGSEVEKLYGIKIATFRIAKLSFSPEAQKAFEKTRSARAEMLAAGERFEKKKIMLLEFGRLMKDSSTEAVNLTETTADVKGITREIISVEGSKQSDLLALGKLIMSNAKGGA